MTFRIVHGLPETQRDAAAALYWEAFGGKLHRVLGPEPRALQFLRQTLREDHTYAAISPTGQLLGLAGFKSPAGSFAGGTEQDLRHVYGRWGAMWRGAILSLMERDVENQRFLLDGICVARHARSQGIGSALMQQIFNEAQSRGYASIRLEVVTSNWRARALYERLGFIATDTETLGLLRFVFGFGQCTTMVRPLAQAGEHGSTLGI